MKSRITVKHLFTALLAAGMITVCSPALAIKASSEPLEGAHIGVAYMLPGTGEVYGTRMDEYFHPASTQKIVTALAAMLYLGPDYTLNTTLSVTSPAVTDGRLNVTEDGTLNANVVVHFTGDPSFTAAAYTRLLKTLSTHGVKKINGKVLLDVSRFGGPDRANGWSWNDIPVCFTVPATPIVINRNCAYAELTHHGVGTVSEPLISSRVPISITSDAVAVANRDYGGDCELQTLLYIDNRYHITGCVPAENKGRPWPLSLSVSDSERWGVDWTEQLLEDLKLKHNGVAVIHQGLNDLTEIAVIKSEPLKELITYMLYRSNNLYADAIAKNIAAEYYAVPATYARAARAMRAILSRYADLDLGNAYIVDGSGLSPHNLITPRQLLTLLSYIDAHDKELGLLECFPVSGESGTLHWRGSTVNAPLKHNVIAKTGTLQNISNLAGFVRTDNGKLAPFVMFTNAITYPERTRDLVRFHRIASPHYAYERYVLENIYARRVMGRDF